MVSIAAFQAVDPGSIPGRRNIFSISGRPQQEENTPFWHSEKIYSIPGVQKGFPTPGIEPGPPGWEPGILTTRPYRIGCSMWGLLSRDTLMGQQQVSFHRWYSSSSIHMPLWRNRLARSAVNREAGGSSPPRGATFCFAPPPFSLTLSHFGRHKTSIEWPHRVPGSLV